MLGWITRSLSPIKKETMRLSASARRYFTTPRWCGIIEAILLWLVEACGAQYCVSLLEAGCGQQNSSLQYRRATQVCDALAWMQLATIPVCSHRGSRQVGGHSAQMLVECCESLRSTSKIILQLFDSQQRRLLRSITRRKPSLASPRRLARPRTSPFHGGNTGSNPVGDANKINQLVLLSISGTPRG